MARILIIDDSATVVAQIRSWLESCGHEVDHLDMAIRLPRVLKERTPDLIVLDLQMPMLNGFKIGEHIRRIATQKIPIVIYSSANLDVRLEAVKNLDAVAHLEKACPRDSFLAVIGRFSASPLRDRAA